MENVKQKPLEIWGGVECTINRVGDQFFSQLERSGHRLRLSDLDRFAELGLRTLRFPILWEELAPDSLDVIDWSATDAQLTRLRELAIGPIAGLVHHGSGPRYTDLLDPRFPEKLAGFARAVAQRYPWIEAYTPVNEPLTTARFSGLYGHWYPHARDGAVFARALLNQCRGVVLAMRAIREVVPEAILIQTEDLGKTFSTPSLQYQVDFENERRWLTWDLLCGRVDQAHPMWSYFIWLGLEEREVTFFAENPCPPEIIGVNHYVASERFLDPNVRDHPPESCGGNGRDRYADVAAVRERAEGVAGPKTLLRETWERYQLPIAVTEAHLGCTREEQLRWLAEIWAAAQTLRHEGVDLRAVTSWAQLGSFDWNSLLTRRDEFYETGAFDLRSPEPRPTAIARMVCELANGRPFEHPILATPGWWSRGVCSVESLAQEAAEARSILITGGGGRFACAFVRAAQSRGLAYQVLTRAELDIADQDSVEEKLRAIAPWAVINCAGFADVDEAEENEAACQRANVTGAAVLAAACAKRALPLVTFSSDFVFDGGKSTPYLESDECSSLNVYGESKMDADQHVLAAWPRTLLVRPGKIFAPFEENDALRERLRALGRGEAIRVADDIKFSPTYLPDLVDTTLDLLIDAEAGVWHLAHPEAVTPKEFLTLAAEVAEIDSRAVEGVPGWSLGHRALRPRFRALGSERGQLLPPLENALRRYWSALPAFDQTIERAVAIR